MSPSEKAREVTLRRTAERQSLRLSRSRRRDVRATDYGTYTLLDPATGDVRLASKSLDDIEDFLTGKGAAIDKPT